MAPKSDAGKPKVVRNAKVTILPPGILSFNALLKPDDKFGDPTFYCMVELDEQALEKMSTMVSAECEGLYKKMAETYDKLKPMVNIQGWLEDRVKTPTDEKYAPTVKFSVKSEGKGRDGEVFNRTITIWDVKNNRLDLAKLKMGRGSIVQVVVKVGLYSTALVPAPTPTLQLIGVRVLKLVQFGGQGNLDALDPTDVEGIELDEDLGAFAVSNHPAKNDDDLEEAASPF